MNQYTIVFSLCTSPWHQMTVLRGSTAFSCTSQPPPQASYREVALGKFHTSFSVYFLYMSVLTGRLCWADFFFQKHLSKYRFKNDAWISSAAIQLSEGICRGLPSFALLWITIALFYNVTLKGKQWPWRCHALPCHSHGPSRNDRFYLKKQLSCQFFIPFTCMPLSWEASDKGCDAHPSQWEDYG